MAQNHLVVCYDTEEETLKIEYDTTNARFQTGNVYDEWQGWREPTKNEELLTDEIIDVFHGKHVQGNFLKLTNLNMEDE